MHENNKVIKLFMFKLYKIITATAKKLIFEERNDCVLVIDRNRILNRNRNTEISVKSEPIPKPKPKDRAYRNRNRNRNRKIVCEVRVVKKERLF